MHPGSSATSWAMTQESMTLSFFQVFSGLRWARLWQRALLRRLGVQGTFAFRCNKKGAHWRDRSARRQVQIGSQSAPNRLQIGSNSAPTRLQIGTKSAPIGPKRLTKKVGRSPCKRRVVQKPLNFFVDAACCAASSALPSLRLRLRFRREKKFGALQE